MGRAKKKVEDKHGERDTNSDRNSPINEDEVGSEFQNEEGGKEVRKKKSGLKRKGKQATSPRKLGRQKWKKSGENDEAQTESDVNSETETFNEIEENVSKGRGKTLVTFNEDDDVVDMTIEGEQDEFLSEAEETVTHRGGKGRQAGQEDG